MLARLILLYLIMFAAVLSFAQTGTLKGRITDASTKQSLPFATVYINNTTYGVYANDKGEYELSIPAGTYDVIASYIGHQPLKHNVNIIAGVITAQSFALDLNTLKAVEITSRRDARWHKEYKKFQKLFIGTGKHADLCQIVNPYGLTFDDSRKQFSATSSQTLVIENMYLGYKVYFDLNNFVASKKEYYRGGYVRFEELLTMDTVLSKTWRENRKQAYRGSLGHFLKSVVDHSIKANGYELYEDVTNQKEIIRMAKFQYNLSGNIAPLSLKGKVLPLADSSRISIFLPRRTEIHYKNGARPTTVYWDVSYPVSWMEVKGGVLYVNREGTVLNPLSIVLLGQMLEARVMQMLPANYHPDVTERILKPAMTAKQNPLNYLAEKPYLHTDRSAYYTGEEVWFKAYMMHGSSIRRDSLSKVLHIDLVDSSNTIVLTKAFQIDDQYAQGNFNVHSGISPGGYMLRAYTQWMLNFDTTFIFTKPLRILSGNQRIRSASHYDTLQHHDIVIETKDYYSPRDPIVIAVSVLDEFDAPAAARLSMSVTDMSQASPAKNEKYIVDNFYLPLLSDTLTIRKNFIPIQRGFTLSGDFMTNRGKKAPGTLIFVQEESDKRFSIMTTADGHFHIPNLQLYDSMKISHVARDEHNRYGSVVFERNNPTPKPTAHKPLMIEVYHDPGTPHKIVASTEMKTTLLKAVEITDKKIERSTGPSILFDYEITSEWLEQTNATDVLSALQTKIPGFRIVISYDRDGVPVKRIQISPPSSFQSGGEPLVLLDGIALDSFGEALADQISGLRPELIDRIEIIKYGNGAIYGVRGGNGVISIHTRRGNAAPKNVEAIPFDKSRLKPVTFDGYAVADRFLSPNYGDPERTKDQIDLRTTIYWDPDVNVFGDNPAYVTFYAADVETRYRIVIEGITSDGKPVSGEKIITIRRSTDQSLNSDVK